MCSVQSYFHAAQGAGEGCDEDAHARAGAERARNFAEVDGCVDADVGLLVVQCARQLLEEVGVYRALSYLTLHIMFTLLAIP